jgi:hypothetical protein
MLTYRIYFANEGKLDGEATDLLDRAAKLLGLSQRQSEKIVDVCEVLTRPIA